MNHSPAIENVAITASDHFIELVFSCDIAILVGWTPIASLTTAGAKLDAAAIVCGRVPDVRLGREAGVECASTARLE